MKTNLVWKLRLSFARRCEVVSKVQSRVRRLDLSQRASLWQVVDGGVNHGETGDSW